LQKQQKSNSFSAAFALLEVVVGDAVARHARKESSSKAVKQQHSSAHAPVNHADDSEVEGVLMRDRH
jgi:hypothetical protein